MKTKQITADLFETYIKDLPVAKSGIVTIEDNFFRTYICINYPAIGYKIEITYLPWKNVYYIEKIVTGDYYDGQNPVFEAKVLRTENSNFAETEVQKILTDIGYTKAEEQSVENGLEQQAEENNEEVLEEIEKETTEDLLQEPLEEVLEDTGVEAAEDTIPLMARGGKTSWYVTKKPDEKIYVLYDFARNEEQAKNLLRDLHEGSPVAHKSTSEGGEYNIYVKKGSPLWMAKGGKTKGKRKLNFSYKPKKYMHGGKTENVKDEIASHDLKEEIKKANKKNEDVIHFAYTDYGGTILDKFAIDYFIKNHPKNIVWEDTAYHGKNAFVFGKPATDWIKATEDYPLGYENFEDYFYERERDQEDEDWNYFIKEELERNDYKFDREQVLDWLRENRSGYYNMTTQGLDFSWDELVSKLESEGLISKKEDDEMKRGGKTKSKKWFQEAVNEKAPFDLGGWHKDEPADKRRKLALQSRDQRTSLYSQYLSASRALQALANVTKDFATKEVANQDAKYFRKEFLKFKDKK